MLKALALQHMKDACWDYLNNIKGLRQIRTEDIQEIYPEIFEGGYATVQRARLKDSSHPFVALKTLKYEFGDNTKEAQSRWVKYFAKELRHIAKISHENIVKIEGFYLDDGRKPVIVSAWASGGTMSDYTKDHPDCNLRNIAAGIARGLEYIHKNGIIHADLKGANILMTEDGVPMLSDFGQARAIHYTVTVFVTTHHLREKGTLNWIAPEIANYIDNYDNPNEIICTRQSDMWSYGMVIYELITGNPPYSDTSVNDPPHIRDAKLQRIIARAQQLNKPENLDKTREWLWKLHKACCKKSPTERMSALQVVKEFTDYDATAEKLSPVEDTEDRRITMNGGGIFWITIMVACFALLLYSIAPTSRWI